jgi:hypothetical protein
MHEPGGVSTSRRPSWPAEASMSGDLVPVPELVQWITGGYECAGPLLRSMVRPRQESELLVPTGHLQLYVVAAAVNIHTQRSTNATVRILLSPKGASGLH